MTRTLLFTILAVLLCFFSCRKSHTNTAHCTTTGLPPAAHPMDTDSVYYFLPTAFTPNGDGRNDLYKLFYQNVIADSSIITIWNMSGTEIFKQNITAQWDGTDESGHQSPPGNYAVRLQLLTKTGTKIDVCTYVALFHYTGSCLNTNGTTYYFPDQVNPDSGFVYPTNETLCP